MPRIPHKILAQARKTSPLLPLVLRGARTIESASNELRWLRQHVKELHAPFPEKYLLNLCQRRARGEPLQYIIGTQPFGDLDIKCRPGVLIPRSETEAYTIYLARILNEGFLDDQFNLESTADLEVTSSSSPLRIVDMCTGTGCISLLLYSLLSQRFPGLSVTGCDISNHALRLAQENLIHNLGNRKCQDWASTVNFNKLDLFDELSSSQIHNLKCDVLISNPPYISEYSFSHETTRSVRNWEPKLALVPAAKRASSVAPEDIFYERLLSLHRDFLQSKILLMEVGDDAQAIRVAEMVINHKTSRTHDLVEIWRDWPEGISEASNNLKLMVGGHHILVRGSGKLRSVFVRSQLQ
ncbi:HemK family methyltransferase [Tricladium varicosporioides]|nr:HemK family methyltransferase [Hymenoscyphus varicosporioides]